MGTPSAPGVFDSLREGSVNPVSSQLTGAHPLENRLAKWDETQTEFQLAMQTRIYGPGLPIKRAVEMDIVNQTTSPNSWLFRPDSSRSVHQDILQNKETRVDWEDVFPSTNSVVDVHAELQRRLNI